MKAILVTKPGKLEIYDHLPTPEISEYQVLVKQLACGICTGTDTKLLHGKFKGYNSYPAILGHEAVGRVEAKGSKVRNFQLGDLILRTGLGPNLINPNISYCYGAFAEYGIAGDAQAMLTDGATGPEHFYTEKYLSQQVLPASMAPVDGTLLITFKEVLSALLRFGISKQATILIFGMGPVGLSMVRISRLLGAKEIVTCDINDDKLKLAARAGADAGFNPDVVSPADWAAQHGDKRFDFVIDAVGVGKLINLALPLLNFNGSMCVYGVAAETSHTVDWTLAPYNWNLKFVQWPTMQEESACHKQVLNWVQAGQLIPSEFYSHILPFDQYEQGFELLRDGKALKVILDFTL